MHTSLPLSFKPTFLSLCTGRYRTAHQLFIWASIYIYIKRNRRTLAFQHWFHPFLKHMGVENIAFDCDSLIVCSALPVLHRLLHLTAFGAGCKSLPVELQPFPMILNADLCIRLQYAMQRCMQCVPFFNLARPLPFTFPPAHHAHEVRSGSRVSGGRWVNTCCTLPLCLIHRRCRHPGCYLSEAPPSEEEEEVD